MIFRDAKGRFMRRKLLMKAYVRPAVDMIAGSYFQHRIVMWSPRYNDLVWC